MHDRALEGLNVLADRALPPLLLLSFCFQCNSLVSNTNASLLFINTNTSTNIESPTGFRIGNHIRFQKLGHNNLIWGLKLDGMTGAET